jgi:Ca2+-transporting ATPase
MMILWANIIADVPPAMSLGLEPCEPDVMDRKPRPPDQGVLTFWTASTILVQGCIMGLLAFTVYLLCYYNVINWYEGNLPAMRTLAFVTLTTGQLLQALLSRSVYQSSFVMGIRSNKYMIFAVLLSLALECLGIYTPGLNGFLTLVPLDGRGWGIVFISFLCQVILVETWKAFMRSMMKQNVMIPRRNTGFFSKV